MPSVFLYVKEIDLSHSRLKTLPPSLLNLTKIKVLTLRQNVLKDISPLQKLPTLSDLDVYDNELTEIPDLSMLTQLEYVAVIIYNNVAVIIYNNAFCTLLMSQIGSLIFPSTILVQSNTWMACRS